MLVVCSAVFPQGHTGWPLSPPCAAVHDGAEPVPLGGSGAGAIAVPAPGGGPGRDTGPGSRGSGRGLRTPVSCLGFLGAPPFAPTWAASPAREQLPGRPQAPHGPWGSRRGLSGGPGPRSRLAAAPHLGGGWRGGRGPYARSRAPAAPAPARYSSRGYAGCRRPDYASTRFWGSLARCPAPAWLSKQ